MFKSVKLFLLLLFFFIDLSSDSIDFSTYFLFWASFSFNNSLFKVFLRGFDLIYEISYNILLLAYWASLSVLSPFYNQSTFFIDEFL